MSQDKLSVISVPFHEDTITAIETPDAQMVAVRPICERLGMSWSSQLQRLKAEKRWRGVAINTPSAGGLQETYCIPRSKLFGWLASISANRVKPEVRAMLELYQDEADDVLAAYFLNRDEVHVEEIRQLRGQLDHCHAHLKAADPKWGQLLAMMEAGTYSLSVIAKRLNWSQDRTLEEMHAIQRCGMVHPDGVADNTASSWLERIAELERMLQNERDWRQAEARSMSVAAYRAERENPDQLPLFGEV